MSSLSGRGRHAGILAAVAVAAAVLAGTAAPPTPATAVAHGWPAPAGRYRFATKLTMTAIPRRDGTTYDSACSAALIAPSWVITARHCFHDVDRHPVSGPVPYPTVATIGRADLGTAAAGEPGGHTVAVTTVQAAPNADVAVARLARPVTDIPPIGLATSAPELDQTLWLAGWGATGREDPVPSQHLQTGLVTVASIGATTLGLVGRAPAPDTSACVYDSGAPYFREQGDRTLLVAVESDGPTCPHDRQETASRVDPLVPWILRATTVAAH